MKSLCRNRRDRLAVLSTDQLAAVRGGDLCIVGYRSVDEDGDGRIDYLVPIYAQCDGAEHGVPRPTS